MFSKTTNGFDSVKQIYCINLRKRTDRLSRFIDSFPDFWMNKLQVVAAVDGYTHTLSESEKHNLRNANWDIEKGRGQWGCSFSHELIWRTIVKENIEYAIILEDDAIFKGSESRIEETMKMVKLLNLPICFLGPDNHPENTLSAPHDFSDNVCPRICRIKSNLGTMSYIISLQGAKDLLNIIEEKGHYRAVDQVINDYMKNRNEWFCSSPPLFSINPGLGSDIKPVESWRPLKN
jgi:GR25 family glycosyltransferase involved in LPS biosynthesis